MFYSKFIDYYAPAVVGNLTWNNDANMTAHCCTTDLRMFAKHVLSVCDEAFIILVLVNAANRSMHEIIRDTQLVRTNHKHIASKRFVISILIVCSIACNRHRKRERGQRKAKEPCQYVLQEFLAMISQIHDSCSMQSFSQFNRFRNTHIRVLLIAVVVDGLKKANNSLMQFRSLLLMID